MPPKISRPLSELDKQVQPLPGEADPKDARHKAALYAAVERIRLKPGLAAQVCSGGKREEVAVADRACGGPGSQGPGSSLAFLPRPLPARQIRKVNLWVEAVSPSRNFRPHECQVPHVRVALASDRPLWHCRHPPRLCRGHRLPQHRRSLLSARVAHLRAVHGVVVSHRRVGVALQRGSVGCLRRGGPADFRGTRPQGPCGSPGVLHGRGVRLVGPGRGGCLRVAPGGVSARGRMAAVGWFLARGRLQAAPSSRQTLRDGA